MFLALLDLSCINISMFLTLSDYIDKYNVITVGIDDSQIKIQVVINCNCSFNTWPLKVLLLDLWAELFEEMPQWSVTWLKLECRAINPLEETQQLIRVVTKLNTPSESQFRTTIRLLNVFPNMGSSIDLLMVSLWGFR